ncbi:MAG: non-homologous end-joining DNA ligase, partial [Acidimicrobiales bacterium]
VDVGGHQLKLSNLDKVLYPATGFTKGEVIDYYARIGPVLVGHLDGRPTTLKRYPNGVEGQFFFEKNCPGHRPDWVSTAPIWSGHSRRTIDYCVVDGVATLVWLANLAALELHPSLSRAADLRRPTMAVFDLDPGPPADIVACCEVALHLRHLFDQLGLSAWPKTSGSKGLQVYVPLNGEVSYEGAGGTKTFALAVAQYLERAHPKLVVSSMAKDQRVGRVFIDWSQNDDSKTTVAVYSMRARGRPTVSTPVSWDEVERADRAELSYEAPAVLTRVADHGDLFAPVLSVVQQLPDFGL